MAWAWCARPYVRIVWSVLRTCTGQRVHTNADGCTGLCTPAVRHSCRGRHSQSLADERERERERRQPSCSAVQCSANRQCKQAVEAECRLAGWQAWLAGWSMTQTRPRAGARVRCGWPVASHQNVVDAFTRAGERTNERTKAARNGRNGRNGERTNEGTANERKERTKEGTDEGRNGRRKERKAGNS